MYQEPNMGLLLQQHAGNLPETIRYRRKTTRTRRKRLELARNDQKSPETLQIVSEIDEEYKKTAENTTNRTGTCRKTP